MMMVLLLSNSDVFDLMDMPKAIECTEQAFLAQSAGEVYAWAPIIVGHDDRELRVNAGALKSLGRAGVRFGMKGGATAIFDTGDQRLACIMSFPWGYIRVGATVALAVDKMAAPDAKNLMVIGTGAIARKSLEGVSCLRTFDRIQVNSRDAGHRQEYVTWAKDTLGLDVEAVEDLETGVREAQVVVMATNSHAPVLHGEWLAEGTHVSTSGIRCEVDDAAFVNAGMVVVGSKPQEIDYVGWILDTNDNALKRLATDGPLTWDGIAELGDVLSGARPMPTGTTVFRESQGGFGDVAIADFAFGEAKRLGRGQTWEPSS
jgi:ornithine cyclodeaminase/alanine dehydrogenase-like protein (mu-crystallin family)